MTLEKLQSEMIQAMKNKDKLRKSVLSGLVDAVKKVAIDKNCRDNITEELVDEVLLKYKKTVQEQIDTCPTDRIETLAEYNAQMAVVTEFAPTLIIDETEIRYLIIDIININNHIELTKSNRGKIMKTVAPILKGKVDMSIVNKVLGGMLQ
jgi:uncharacterized protein YqeY